MDIEEYQDLLEIIERKVMNRVCIDDVITHEKKMSSKNWRRANYAGIRL